MNKIDQELFEEMKKLINEQNEDDFVFFVSKNEYLLKVDPILFIGNHVSFYAEREDVSKALEVVSYYKNAPYISMEVEDFLNELKLELTKLNENKVKEYNFDKIRKMLFSKNEEALASALGYLSKQNIRYYIPLIKEFLLSEVAYKYKTLALFILVEQKVDEQIKVSKNGRIFTYNPSFLTLPFDSIEYKNCKKTIELLSQNKPYIGELAIELLNTIQIKEYPASLIEEYDYVIIAEILLDMASIAMNEKSKIEEIVKKYNLNLEELEFKIKEINRIILE
ncbi:MAG: hypothetical protein E7177_02210 [Erysipelotrichaceae bacterium]|nr:hypothetical protein [Erysipelotrichaceae bacterium]